MNNMANSLEKNLVQSFLSQKIGNDSERNINPEKIYECLENAGSIDYCNNKINSYLNNAVASLEPLKQSIYKSYLTRMAESLKMS
jgi:geranylgeranyl pyrophosphate synthase